MVVTYRSQRYTMANALLLTLFIYLTYLFRPLLVDVIS